MLTQVESQADRKGDFVDIEDLEVVRDWTQSLGVSRMELINAVEIVGPSAGKVYDYIRKRQQLSRRNRKIIASAGWIE